MRGFVIWIAVASLALVATSASADVEEQMLQMQQKLQQLEERLDATSDELAAANDRVEQQHELIQSSGLAEARGASSGLSSFLETLEAGGWVAGSYLYNANDPDAVSGAGLGGANSPTGTGLGMYPFHPDANSFQLDQVWFELEKPVSEDSRAGFRADILYGKTAEFLSGGVALGASGSENQLELYQGYVQYLAPISNGVKIQAGKFATTIGAEVAQTPYNLNITRGNVYNLFQPITHTGVMASMENAGASAGIGLVNSNTFAADIDPSNNKSVLWHLGYGEDTWSANFNGVWGAADNQIGATGSGPNERDKETILDLLVTWDPSEQFSGYVNANWREVENAYTGGLAPAFSGACGNAAVCNDADAWGVAVAGRYAISDRMGFSVRGEYVEDSDSFLTQLAGTGTPATPGEETEIISVTGTVDYSLTEQLMLRGEVRWDEVDVSGPPGGGGIALDNVFRTDSSTNRENDQVVGAVEIIYNF